MNKDSISKLIYLYLKHLICLRNNKFHVIAPGCLHEPKTEMLEWLMYKTPNDILKTLTKEISTICNLKDKSSISPSELEDIVLKKFSGKHDLIRKYSAALQVSPKGFLSLIIVLEQLFIY